MSELSIIVPVYKVEKYLPKCIDSILAQTFKDFELILIDDGSPDNCGKICDEYAEKDNRIVVIHQENAGVSAARNAGLDIATGTYIGFVDSDDWIEPDMYEVLINTAKCKNADVAVCGFNVYTNEAALNESTHLVEGEYDRNSLLFDLFGKPCKLGGSCCNRIFLCSKIADIRFPKGLTIAEDRLYLFCSFLKMDTGHKCATPLYNVRCSENSATRNGDVNTFFKILKSSRELIAYAKTYSKELEGAALDKYIDDIFLYSRQIEKCPDKPLLWKLNLKKDVAEALLYSQKNKLLPKARIHGYIYELIKL